MIAGRVAIVPDIVVFVCLPRSTKRSARAAGPPLTPPVVAAVFVVLVVAAAAAVVVVEAFPMVA